MNFTEDQLRAQGYVIVDGRAVKRPKGVMPSAGENGSESNSKRPESIRANGGVTHPPTNTSKVDFTVIGIARPQGSMRAPKAGVVIHSSPRVSDWREHVAASCPRGVYFSRPAGVSVSLMFVLPRPKSLPKTPQRHTKKPDLDKLIRACFDAVKSVIWDDDAQVDSITTTKRYAAHGELCGVRFIAETL